jgi:RNA polymerase sigma factor (sigma-70 family)
VSALPPDTGPPTRNNLTDGEDFEDFFRSFFPQAVGYVMANGYDRETAIGATQDAMLAAYRSWTVITHPRAWIMKVAYRKALDQTKRQPREQLVAEFNDEQFGTLQPAEDNWEQLLGLLAGLPAVQRKILFLRVAGYTPDDIAAEMGGSAASVRSSLRKARETVRRRLLQSPAMATNETE